jgi:hypothetical protein
VATLPATKRRLPALLVRGWAPFCPKVWNNYCPI